MPQADPLPRAARTLSFFLLILLLAFSIAGQSPPADLLLLNANIITMDPQRPLAQAIAIRGDRITWVGTAGEAKKLFHGDVRTIDLHGATVLPGLIDAHTHLLSLGQSLLRLNLKGANTEAEVVARVKQRAATSKPGEWILGWGWDEGEWASRYPSNDTLSAASPRNPVYLVGLHSFASWANKKALELAGIDKNTKDPENGKILRDEKTGEPTGILLNRAQELVSRKIPPLTLEQVKKAIDLAAHECVRYGLTSVHEAGVSPLELTALRELLREGRLPLRVSVMLDGANRAWLDEWLRRGPEIDPRHQLTVRSVKLFADGALGSRGAALFEPYADATQTKGQFTTPEPEIYALTRRCLEKGFQVATHAIGNAANHIVLDAYQRALREVPAARDARLRIEHAQVLAPEDIPRFAKLGVIASMQPPHCTSDMPWAEKRVGAERIRGAYAWRSVLKTGAHLPLSSDFPGESLNPFDGIYAAITRQDASGTPPGGWYPEQKLTLEEALRGYTLEAAYAEFEENIKGSIAPGKLADLTVISKDITKFAPKEILSLRVRETWLAGKQIFSAARDN